MAQHELLVKLGLQSDSFTRNIKNVNNQLKLTESEFKKLQSSTTNFGSSQKDLEAKLKSLSKTKEQLTAKTLLYKNKITELNSNIKKSSSEHEKLSKKLETEKNNLNDLGDIFGKNSKEYKEQQKVVKDLQTEYDKSKKKIENLNLSLQKNEIALNETETALNKLNSTINDTKFDKATLHINQMGQKLDTLSGKLNTISSKFTEFGTVMTAGVTAPIAAAGKSVIQFGAEFESSMSKVQALSRASGDDMVKLEAKAREMGKATSFTAKEAADGLGYMALAGWKVDEMLTSIEPVLRLAEAGEFDLATASDLVTDSMSTMGLTVGELEDYLNKVALSSSLSNTSVEQMLRTYNQVGGTFKRFNVPLEESGALIGVLANRGLKAEQAGRSLSSILINLTGGSTTAAKALDALNVSAYDSKGNFRGIEEVLVDLHKELYKVENGTAKYTEEQRNSYLAMIGGKTQIRTLDALLNGVAETTADGTTEFAKLKEELLNSNGALETMSNTMKDNVEGDWERFTSMLGELALTINDLLKPAIRNILQWATNLIDKFINLDESTQKFIVKAAILAAAIGPASLAIAGITKALSVFTGGLSSAIGFGLKFTKNIKNIGTAVKGGTSLFSALSAVIGGLPAILGIAAAAFVGIAAALGENESVLATLQEKWGIFGTFVGGVCESIAGIVQLTLGNVLVGLGTLGKVITKVVTLKWNEIDDVISEGASKMAQNTNKAFDNMTMSSTAAITKMRNMTSNELNGLVGDMEFILEKLPGISYDTADATAEQFASGLKHLDNTAIEILSSTSETMNMLFRGIHENMSNQEAVDQYTKNLKSLAKTGGVEVDQLRLEINKTLDLINNNMADSGDRFAREAEIAMDKFGSIASQGVENAADDIASHLSKLNTNTQSELQSMGNHWSLVFKNVATDGTMSTSEMARNIEDNIKRLAKNNPKFVEQLQKEMKTYFDKMPEDASSSMLSLTEVLSTGTQNAVGSTEGAGQTIEENLSFDASTGTSEELSGMETVITNSTGALSNAALNLGEETAAGYELGLSGLDTTTIQKMQDQATNIQASSNKNKSAMQDNALSSIDGFVSSWDSNSGRINESINSTFDNINRLTLLKWGNTTKGLSEVNKWLGTVSNKAGSTYTALNPLTSLKWGNTTQGLSQVNNWLGTVSSKANSTRSAMTPLTSLSWGNTTKGLSEVNKWLGTVSNSSKTTQNALKSLTAITYGSQTKGLSEVNKWLGSVKSGAANAKNYLQSMANVRFGGLTSSLSEVSRWLSTVSSRASVAKSAVSGVSRARSVQPFLANDSEMSNKISILNDNLNNYQGVNGYNVNGSYLNKSRSIESGIAEVKKQTSSVVDDLVNTNLVQMLVKQNEMLMQLLTSDRNIVIENVTTLDGKVLARSTSTHTNNELNKIKNRKNRLAGVY